jgi:hypothetical protein
VLGTYHFFGWYPSNKDIQPKLFIQTKYLKNILSQFKYLVRYHVLKFFLTMISIYQMYDVIYQSNIGFEYEQLGFHIFCKKVPLWLKKRKESKYKTEK